MVGKEILSSPSMASDKADFDVKIPKSHPNSENPDGSGQGDVESGSRKRKRRILSCDTCRRLKCRCDVENAHGSCKRCLSLRLPCSLTDNQNDSPTRHLSCTGSDLGQRLQSIEGSLAELRDMTRALRPSHQPLNIEAGRKREDFIARPEKQIKRVRSPGGFEPADRDVYASPTELVRKVGSQLNGGRRRTFEQRIDLVSSGVLDESTARNLVDLFVRHRGKTLLIDNENDLTTGRDLRTASPFLHAVCCVAGIRYTQYANNASSTLHPRVFEQVRQMLGEVMVSSPLRLEELTGILILALFHSAPTATDYLDSWLLSGQCAQHAMLSINFSQITTRTGSGTATLSDQRELRFWASTCLTHLHWSASTGRPPIIPPVYLSQCRILLNFEQATIRDGMVYAEILLYSLLHENFASGSYLDAHGQCENFSAWRTKWAYLLDLPTSGLLRLSYSIVSLIQTRRSMKRQEDSHPNPASSSASPAPHPPPSTTTTPKPTEPPPSSSSSHLLTHALSVLQSFLSLPGTTAHDLSEFYFHCVAYALLILSKHHHHQRPPQTHQDEAAAAAERSPEEDPHRLVQKMERWCRSAKTPAMVPNCVRFGVEMAGRSFASSATSASASTEGQKQGRGQRQEEDWERYPAEGEDVGRGFSPWDAAGMGADGGMMFLEGGGLGGMDSLFHTGYLGLEEDPPPLVFWE